MELRQLEYLRAVVRMGSVTGAAEAVSVSQPSVSKQIKLLAACAERIADDLAQTVDALTQLAASLRGSLRLCATETVTDHLLPPALAELRRGRPRRQRTGGRVGTDHARPHG